MPFVVQKKRDSDPGVFLQGLWWVAFDESDEEWKGLSLNAPPNLRREGEEILMSTKNNQQSQTRRQILAVVRRLMFRGCATVIVTLATTIPLTLASTWWRPITLDMPASWNWSPPFTTQIRWMKTYRGHPERNRRFNDITIDMKEQMHWWFPKVVDHPKRWPRGSA